MPLPLPICHSMRTNNELRSAAKSVGGMKAISRKNMHNSKARKRASGRARVASSFWYLGRPPRFESVFNWEVDVGLIVCIFGIRAGAVTVKAISLIYICLDCPCYNLVFRDPLLLYVISLALSPFPPLTLTLVCRNYRPRSLSRSTTLRQLPAGALTESSRYRHFNTGAFAVLMLSPLRHVWVAVVPRAMHEWVSNCGILQ